jgi:hypothetical protein
MSHFTNDADPLDEGAHEEANRLACIAQGKCPECEHKLSFGGGSDGSRDEPPQPALDYCESCGWQQVSDGVSVRDGETFAQKPPMSEPK